jgi:hypothetical protein
LLISCEHCKAALFRYQKDGPGILKRLYLDRIVVLNNKIDPLTEQLICTECQHLLGVRIIYDKEDRPAYRLFAGAIEKQIVK